ncbi:MAG: winged helix-turn-helix transcriptional regulator [Elusimicrobia bacterium]|nr:winged helix-turn-helix transcriptional regulator [Elusimicrobiota bacterium]
MESSITEKEFAVITELSNNHLPNQRTIAKKLGISLGLTNLIIKRLAKTGYIKIKQLNRRQIRYVLTPKGFSEKARKSYNYTLRTINNLTLMREKIQNLAIAKYKTGIRNFIIVGDNELADITEISLKKLPMPDIKYTRELKNGKEIDSFTLILNTKNKNGKSGKNLVNLISYLTESGLNI